MPLDETELRVLGVFRGKDRHLTLGFIRSRTGIPSESLVVAVDGLRAKGLLTRLNTVVESYACRFPGLRIDDV